MGYSVGKNGCAGNYIFLWLYCSLSRRNDNVCEYSGFHVKFNVDSNGFPAYYQEEISRETSEDIAVVGLRGVKNQLAGCCNPTPGDEIVGFITRGRGATIHRKECANILNVKDKERLVEVSWGSPVRTFPVPIVIKAYDRDGLTKDIATVLSNNIVRLSELRVDVDDTLGEAVFNLVLGVRNVAELRRALDLLERVNNVYEARRVRSA